MLRNSQKCISELVPKKCRVFAFEFAIANGLAVPTSWQENWKAGLHWCEYFRNRLKLSIRIPEATSIARSTAFNSRVVNSFYDNLASVMDQHAFEPNDRYLQLRSKCLPHCQALREKTFQGVRRLIPAPKSYWPLPSLIGAHAVKSFFVR